MKGGLKMVNNVNFIASLKCLSIKMITQYHKPVVDILDTIKGNGFH